MLRRRSEAGQPVAERTLAEVGRPFDALLPQPDGLEQALTAAEDTPIEVHWAEQRFVPVPYNSFGVGPFKATVMVRKGESIPDAVYRMWQALDELAQRIRVETGTGFLKSLEDVTTAARTPR
jgi:hypothetical protein